MAAGKKKNQKNPGVMPERKNRMLRIWKIARWVLIPLAVLLIGLILFLDHAVKQAVNQVGTMVTGTEVELQKVSIRPLAGKVYLEGMSVLNPQGYVNRSAVSFGAFTVQINLFSLLTDKIEITNIRMEKLSLDLEIHHKGTNLGDIKKNVDAFTEKLLSCAPENTAEPQPEKEKPAKKMVIRKLQIMDSSIRLANPNLNLDMSIPLMDIEMTDVGDGRSITEFVQVLYDSIYDAVMTAAKKSGDVFGEAVKNTGKVLQDAAGTLSDSAKSLGIDTGDAARNLGKDAEKAMQGLSKDAEKTVRDLGKSLQGLF